MKPQHLLWALPLLFCACNESKLTNDCIQIDVTNSYPEKELVIQDFAEVEYIPLETTDEFINKGLVKEVGKKFIVVVNGGSDGNIFLYDRSTGKGIRKINRKGQGGEEYNFFTEIILDEEKEELFVNDYQKQQILVYDLEGKYKRNFKFDGNCYYSFTFGYDRDHLMVYKDYGIHDQPEKSCHALISKQDGSTVREFRLPHQEVEDIRYKGMHEKYGEIVATPTHNLITPGREAWYLADVSSDTIYRYFPDGSHQPYLVRTPSINSMNPEVFLFPMMMTDSYDFLVSIKKQMKSNFSFPNENLIYDKQEKAFYSYTLHNADFEGSTVAVWKSSLNPEVATYHPLQAPDLVEAYQDGKLKGRLKEIASTLDKEDNGVVMLIKQKKN